MKIVFLDSGIGGLSVLKKVSDAFPFEQYFYISDRANMPYGNKKRSHIIMLCKKNIELALSLDPDIIIVACNTMATVGHFLFEKIKSAKVLFVKPDLDKIKKLGESNCLIFCTVATAKSRALVKLSRAYPGIIEPQENLASIIENNFYHLSEIEFDFERRAYRPVKNIFLGCTHYALIEQRFRKRFPESDFYDGTEKIMTLLKNVIPKKEGVFAPNEKCFIGSGFLFVERAFAKICEDNR